MVRNTEHKRIDLTQFEGITPTQWRVGYEAVGDTKTVLYVKSDMTAHGNFVIAVLEDAPDGEYTEADANAIAAIPDLIAELKRCYEKIDSGLDAWYWSSIRKSMAKKADFQGNRIESLIDALRIIRDDLDEAIAQGHLPIKSADGIDATKIRNFANDALQ
tara:strand:+ start:28122 stop:28601 length:480 start_codon:yes stop_codon:yes gene_type:complete